MYMYYQVPPVLRGHLGDKEKNSLLRQVSSYKRFNPYEIFYDSTKR